MFLYQNSAIIKIKFKDIEKRHYKKLGKTDNIHVKVHTNDIKHE